MTHFINGFAVIDGITFIKGGHDINGNPLYIIPKQSFLTIPELTTLDQVTKDEIARTRANAVGFKVCRRKSFPYCFIGQSYNIDETARHIAESLKD